MVAVTRGHLVLMVLNVRVVTVIRRKLVLVACCQFQFSFTFICMFSSIESYSPPCCTNSSSLSYVTGAQPIRDALMEVAFKRMQPIPAALMEVVTRKAQQIRAALEEIAIKGVASNPPVLTGVVTKPTQQTHLALVEGAHVFLLRRVVSSGPNQDQGQGACFISSGTRT